MKCEEWYLTKYIFTCKIEISVIVMLKWPKKEISDTTTVLIKKAIDQIYA